jgi:hypothetical protein
MSDHIAAYIRIGGTIPKRLVTELCRAITHEQLALAWGEAHFARPLPRNYWRSVPMSTAPTCSSSTTTMPARANLLTWKSS